MKKGIITSFCVFLIHVASAQATKSDTSLIEIEGTLIEMEQAQDDISFYTWSLYFTLNMDKGWSYLLDSSNLETNIELLQKYCDNINKKELHFNKNYFHNEDEINEFLGKVKKGSKVKVLVSQSSLKEFLIGQKCWIYMESIKIE